MIRMEVYNMGCKPQVSYEAISKMYFAGKISWDEFARLTRWHLL